MSVVRSVIACLALTFALLAGLSSAVIASDSPTGQLGVTGDVSVHDPTMAFDEASGLYVLAGSHNTIRTAPSMRGPWTVAGSVARAPWTLSVPNSSTLWAPHLRKIGDTFYYYYSQSSFGSSNSAIGVKTTKTPAIPSSYVDLGRPIVASGSLSQGGADVDYNAIDPALVQTPDGGWWLVWGSFWDGIFIQRLGADLTTVVGEPTLLASRGTEVGWADNAVEGPAIVYRDGYFYLFVGWDRCCAGDQSTYKVAVGRSSSVTGPYLDHAGVPMREGGGTVILDSRQSALGVTPAGLYRAPGGADVYSEAGADYLVYHSYLPENTLGIRPIQWRGGWPYMPDGIDSAHDGDRFRLISETKEMSLDEISRVSGPSGFGGALQLNGTSPVGYVDLPDGVVSEVAGDFTIALWVKRDSTAGNDWARLFDFGDNTSNFMFLTPAAAAAPTGLRADIVTADGRIAQVPGTAAGVTVPAAWTHVALTASGSTARLWVNGQVVSTVTGFDLRPADLGFTVNNWIGRSQFAADPLLNASVDDVNIFSRALPSSDIGLVMASPGGGRSVGGGDVAWYRFDEAGGALVKDSSSGRDGEAVLRPPSGQDVQNPTPGVRCLTAATDDVVQAACVEGTESQVWELDETPDGAFRLMTGEARCVALADARDAAVELTACDPASDLQKWFVEDTGHGFWRLSSPVTGLALEIAGAEVGIGPEVVAAPRAIGLGANMAPRQQWLLDPMEEAGPDVAVVAAIRCVAGKAVLTVKTTNISDEILDVTVRSDYGVKRTVGLQAGTSVSHAFTTRLPSLQAAQVSVASVAASSARETELAAAYSAVTCR